MVYRGPNEGQGITVYHNGEDKGNDTTKWPWSYTGTGAVKIGRWFDEPGPPYYGSAHVDELIFFNHMLSQSEIVMIKNTA